MSRTKQFYACPGCGVFPDDCHVPGCIEYPVGTMRTIEDAWSEKGLRYVPFDGTDVNRILDSFQSVKRRS